LKFVSALEPVQPSTIFDIDECRVILLNAAEPQGNQTRLLIQEKCLHLSVQQAVVHVVTTLSQDDAAKWLQFYVNRVSKLQNRQDKVGEALAEYADKAFPNNSFERFADAGQIMAYFESVKERRRPARDRQAKAKAIIGEHWGRDWEQSITLGNNTELV
jgi:hypothetical protein